MKILESQDVRLLPLSAEHEAEFVRLANIPEINSRVNKPLLYTKAHFAEQLGKLQKSSSFVWMIEQNAKIIGVINNAAGRDARVFQGGYWIDPDCWGKGAASAALVLVRDFLFSECGAERIQAVVEPDNSASIRVLEKCGYQCEGLLKKFYPSVNRGLIDVLMYAVIK
jgi:RimJ/RimL family protein N-acetyltransferase